MGLPWRRVCYEENQTHPIKSHISDRNSDQLHIQNSLRSTWSTSTTTKDTKGSLIYIQPTQSTKSTTVGSSLGLWNARSLNGKSAILSDCILSKKIDIMVLTETWFKGNDRDVITIAEINNILPDHQLIHRPRSGACRGGGVCVMLRKGLKVMQNTSQLQFASFESLDVTISSGNTPLRLIVVYRPPPSKKNNLSVDVFMREFTHLLESVIVNNELLTITGDFNLHIDNLNGNSTAASFMDLIDLFGLCQLVTEPTHQRGHLLDLIITKSTTRNLLTGVRVQFDLPSDHAVVTTRLSVPCPVPTKILVNHRILKAIDLDAFKSSVCSSTITPLTIDTCNTVNELTDTYNSVLCNLMDFHAPCRSPYITLRPHAPWFDDRLRAAKQDKRRLERKWRKM